MWEPKLYCRLCGSAATDSESVRELLLIRDLLCPQSSHLSCGCQTQQIEEAGTEISHIFRSLNEVWEGERELSVWMGVWFGLLEGWSTRILKKSGKRRKTRENNVAKKKKKSTTLSLLKSSVCVCPRLSVNRECPAFLKRTHPDSVCEAEKKGN